MFALEYIQKKYSLNLNQHQMPIEIPNTNRKDLASLFGELGYKKGAEIGTERGVYSDQLCARNPGLHLYCIDAWQCYSGYREHVTQEKLDDFVEETKERLAKYHVDLIRKFSVAAATDFDDNSLDFVYIDANHRFQDVINDICYWLPKVRQGGILSGHDFVKRNNPAYQCHVVEAVSGYTAAYRIRPWFIMGRKEVRENEHRDKPRSWLWVKE